MDNPLRSFIQWILDEITDFIVYFKVYRPAQREKDPQKRLEKELWIEISGLRLGGMAASGAPATFGKDYYDELPSEEKAAVRKVLLSMLRYDNYSVSQKEAIAYVCSDLGMREAANDINFVREASARSMTIRELRRFKRLKEREMTEHRPM